MRKIKKNEGDMRKKIMSMIWKSDPWLIVSGVLRSLVQIILPYITIVFSAEVINALTGNYYKRALKIVGWMSASVLVVKCVEAFLESDENRRKISLDLYMKEKLNQICYGVKLEKLESHEFQQNYQQAMDGLEYSGGFYAFLVCCRDLAVNSLRAMIAVGFFLELILRAESLSGRVFVVLLAIGIGLGACIRTVNNKQSFQAASQFYQKLVPYNNQLQYFFYQLCADKAIGKDVRTYQLERLICEHESSCHDEILKFLKKIEFTSRKYNVANAVVDGFLWGMTYLLVSLCCIVEKMAVGDLLKYIGIVNQISQALSLLLNSGADVRFKTGFLGNYVQFVETYSVEESNSQPGEATVEIRCENVSYQYENAEKPALSEVTLCISSGTHVAIVGENGSGKSTLLKILLGLYAPLEGVVKVNEKPLETVSNEFAAVFQDFTIFPFTVLQNITVSAESSKEEENRAWEVLERLELRECIGGLPDGIHTALRWNGSSERAKLSGGEEQKLALARALFAQRGAYILDEPSAALDSKSEIALYDFFRKLTGQKTVIFVSHRLFSCLKCDKIFVMDHGKLVQEGTHEQLVEVEGKYREMWQSQIQDFVEEGG